MKPLLLILLASTSHLIEIKCEPEAHKNTTQQHYHPHRGVDDLKRLQMEGLEKDLAKDVAEMVRGFVEIAKKDEQIQAAVAYLLTPEWRAILEKLKARPEYDIFMKIVRAVDIPYRTLVPGNRIQRWLGKMHKDLNITNTGTKSRPVKPSMARYFNGPEYRKHKQRLLNHLATLKQLLGSQSNESKVRENFERIWSYARALPQYRKVKNTLRLLGVNIESHLPIIRLEVLIASATGFLRSNCGRTVTLMTLSDTITKNIRSLLDLFDSSIDRDERLRVALKYLQDKSIKDHLALVRKTPEYPRIKTILKKYRTVYNLFKRYNDDPFDYLITSNNGFAAPSFRDFLKRDEVRQTLSTIRKDVRRLKALAVKEKLLGKQPARRLSGLLSTFLERGVLLTLKGIMSSMGFDLRSFSEILVTTIVCQVAMMLLALTISSLFLEKVQCFRLGRSVTEYDYYGSDSTDDNFEEDEGDYAFNTSSQLTGDKLDLLDVNNNINNVGDIPNSDIKIDYILLSGSLDGKTKEVVEDLARDVLDIFMAYLKEDPGVRAGVLYFDGCHFKKMMYSVEHHPTFKKLKILLARKMVVDLSFNSLVPMKYLLQVLHNTSASHNVEPDFTNLMFAIQERMAEVEPRMIMNYNVYFSSISHRIRESSIAGTVERLIKEVFTFPVCKFLLQELLQMSLFFNALSPLMYAVLSYADPIGKGRSNSRSLHDTSNIDPILEDVEANLELQNRTVTPQQQQFTFRSKFDDLKKAIPALDAISDNNIDDEGGTTVSKSIQ
ncbi:hypothetical protein Trydic_g23273 [Trypoxylus dichotomus]